MGRRRLRLVDFEIRGGVIRAIILAWIMFSMALIAASPFLITALIARPDWKNFFLALALFAACVVALRIFQHAVMAMYQHLRKKLRGTYVEGGEDGLGRVRRQ